MPAVGGRQCWDWPERNSLSSQVTEAVVMSIDISCASCNIMLRLARQLQLHQSGHLKFSHSLESKACTTTSQSKNLLERILVQHNLAIILWWFATKKFLLSTSADPFRTTTCTYQHTVLPPMVFLFYTGKCLNILTDECVSDQMRGLDRYK